jgi:HEPN domain-containing protein
MNKTEFEALAQIRLKEARVLFEAGCWHGAYYLAGYALECTLKACIAKQVKAFDFPDKQLALDSYTHNLTTLIKTAKLNQKLIEKENQDANFKLNWAAVRLWSEESRYDTSIEKSQARDLINAITDTNSGVLAWLMNYL